MSSYGTGESFIDHIYQELINSDEVRRAIKRRGENPKNREEAIKYYMERMQKAHSTQRKIELLKKLYYRRYVIDHLPESYVEMQWRIAREEGYGNIRITDEIKRKMLDEIQTEQRKSIDRWIDYLNSEDVMYPMWFKYYVFQGMLKLGQFDRKKGQFRRRSKDTTSPFIEVNSEALGQMYTILSKMIDNKELDNLEIKMLESGDSFKKLYTSLIINLEESNAKENGITDGKWIKYEQGNHYHELWKSLQCKNTGWCTAGEEVCKEQIKNGDFYVYYTYDKDGSFVNPRIAIRMNGQYEIGEVRGIDKDQNIELEMVDILERKLNEFPNKEGERYKKKVHDMKLLTEIEVKVNANEELTEEELIFLYQLNSYIEGFGMEKDPRIGEIIAKRNPKEDFRRINEDAIIIGMKNNPDSLEYVPVDIPNYDKIAIEVVKKYGRVLQYVPVDTPNYDQIALEAVNNNGLALRHVPLDTPNYDQIALEAVKNNGYALEYVPLDTPNYDQIALDAVKNTAFALEYVPSDTPNYDQIALEAVKKYGRVLEYVPIDTPNYDKIALEAVKKDGLALRYVPIDISNYYQIVLEAVKQDSYFFKYVSLNIPNYEQLASETIKTNPSAIKFVPSNVAFYDELKKAAETNLEANNAKHR